MDESGKGIHILIVDDEESIRYTFEIFLKREGYEVIATASGLEEALVAINEQVFDLIISDIVLEDGSGTDLLKFVQNNSIPCPVVMITGFPNLASATEALRYGAFDYISKPVNKQTLLRIVRQAIKHGRLEREKKDLERENERYRRYLEVIFSSVSDAIITVDDQLNIVQLNETARNWLSEQQPGEFVRLASIAGDMAAACLEDAQQVISEGLMVREHQVECHPAGGGRRMISLTAAPLRDDLEEFAGVVIVARDITVGLPERKVSGRTGFHGFVGCSDSMLAIYRLIENVGKVDIAVLVTGESGTGKELAVEALHAESPRKHMPLVKVDCASMPEGLLESELFGHARGAFTGADRDRPGRLLQADRGTLFLDEIGDISPRMQLRLLRFLQEKTFTPVGRDNSVQVDVRIIAATNVDLRERVRVGSFREDLYYRLKVVEIVLPPLRERRECIALLVHHFLAYFAERLGRGVHSISDQAMRLLTAYRWPGNVRELRHVIERGCVMCQGTTLLVEHLPSELIAGSAIGVGQQRGDARKSREGQATGTSPMPLSEKEVLLEMLARVDGNKSKAARLLGIDRSTLYRKLKRYQLSDN